MILVLLGTQDKPFTSLLDAIQKEINNGSITDRVVVQAGHTNYESNEMEIFDLLPKDVYDETIKEAKLIICHGGVSSIFDGIKNNIPVIATPRLLSRGEHVNDHQLEIIEKFAEEGYILPLYDYNELVKTIGKAKEFIPNKFISTTDKVVNLISNYIDNN